mmetsp:Transcript_12619/g.29619  ORF Transcript_12619/g.29619 Transcript_12619/m.29619 type:complete len:156 (+) Transcript_12619:164-631(+)
MGAHFIPRDDRQRLARRPPVRNSGPPNPALLRRVDSVGSNDPNARLAFAHKLDTRTHEIQDRQLVLQHFYESRVAALERYVAFCVLFHAMAAESSHPWLKHPWNIARSQSNLRVATTASPVSASDASNDADTVLAETRAVLRAMTTKMRGLVAHF